MGRRGLLFVVVCASLVAAASSHAGRPGTWSRITPTNISNFAEPGLARTADGVLHVVWHHQTSPSTEDLVHTRISPSGAVGSSTVIEHSWATLNHQPSLVRTPTGGLALFFSGLHSASSGDPLSGGQLLVTFSDASGSSWSAPQFASTSHANGAIAAALAKDGSFVQAAGDAGNFFHFGIGGAGLSYSSQCCVYDPGIGVDSVSGTVVLGWFSNATRANGLYTQVITPGGRVGQPAYAPGSANGDRTAADQPQQRTPVTGRLGAPGVYLAYGAGYPSYTSVRLLRVGGASISVGRGAGVDDIGLAAAPEGRLWVMWARSGKIYATRSNRAATRFEPVTRIKAPPKTVSLFGLWGEASLGQLDLLTSAGTTSGVAIWHTQVLPRLSARKAVAKLKGKARRVTITVTDAGDPVQGATVILGKSGLTTNASGRAVILIHTHGRVKISKAGYRGTSLRV